MRKAMGLLQTIDGDFDDYPGPFLDFWAQQRQREAVEDVARDQGAEATRHAWKSDEGNVGKQRHPGDRHQAASARVAHEVFSGPELVAESVALGKVHSKYIFKQPQQIPWTPGVAASAFEIGNDPELTVEPALASPDIAFGLAQMF
jgi:hypothetical protein